MSFFSKKVVFLKKAPIFASHNDIKINLVMDTTMISLDTLLNMLRPLSNDNKRWLADHLYKDIEADRVLSSESKTDLFFRQLNGKYIEEKTVDEVVADIRNSRLNNIDEELLNSFNQ